MIRLLTTLVALAVLALPSVSAADEVMIPRQPYVANNPMTGLARVVFLPDSRILIWEGAASSPVHEGNWRRRDGLFCIIESAEFAPLCLKEIARGDGAFSLVFDGRSMEFAPVSD